MFVRVSVRVREWIPQIQNSRNVVATMTSDNMKLVGMQEHGFASGFTVANRVVRACKRACSLAEESYRQIQSEAIRRGRMTSHILLLE